MGPPRARARSRPAEAAGAAARLPRGDDALGPGGGGRVRLPGVASASSAPALRVRGLVQGEGAGALSAARPVAGTSASWDRRFRARRAARLSHRLSGAHVETWPSPGPGDALAPGGRRAQRNGEAAGPWATVAGGCRSEGLPLAAAGRGAAGAARGPSSETSPPRLGGGRGVCPVRDPVLRDPQEGSLQAWAPLGRGREPWRGAEAAPALRGLASGSSCGGGHWRRRGSARSG